MSGFFVAVQRFVGRWIWLACWKSPLARYRMVNNIGTIVWVWIHRNYQPNESE